MLSSDQRNAEAEKSVFDGFRRNPAVIAWDAATRRSGCPRSPRDETLTISPFTLLIPPPVSGSSIRIFPGRVPWSGGGRARFDINSTETSGIHKWPRSFPHCGWSPGTDFYCTRRFHNKLRLRPFTSCTEVPTSSTFACLKPHHYSGRQSSVPAGASCHSCRSTRHLSSRSLHGHGLGARSTPGSVTYILADLAAPKLP